MGGGTYGLDLARVNTNDPDAGGDEFLAQAVGEGADGSLGGTVNAATSIRFAACRCEYDP